MPIVNNELSFGLAGAQGGIIGAKGAPLVAAATITVTDSFHEVSGAGVITTINCDALAPNSLLFLRPAAGSTWSLGTGGNITANVIITVGETVALEWDGTNVHPQGMMAGNAITRSGGSQPLTADLDLGGLYTVTSRNSMPVINLNALGMIGDGVFDNTAILTAALAAVPATGAVLVIGSGNYRATGPFLLKKYTTIVGVGKYSTKFTSPTTDQNFFYCAVYPDSVGIVLRDFTIQSTNAATQTAGAGIRLDGGASGVFFSLTGVQVTGFYNGIYVTTGIVSSMTGVTAFACRNWGFLFEGTCTSLSLDSCWATTCGRAGMGKDTGGYYFKGLSTSSPGMRYSTLSSPAADQNIGVGYRADYVQDMTMVSPGAECATVASGGSDALYLNGCGSVTITSPRFQRGDHGIHVLNSTGPIIIGGRLWESGGNGINVVGSSAVTLINPTVEHPVGDFISVSGGSTDVNLTSPTYVGTRTVSDATNANPIEITTTANHGWSTGGTKVITGVTGNTAANGTWVITVTALNKFTLDTSVGSGAYTGGGTAKSRELVDAAAVVSRVMSATAAWDPGNLVDGAGETSAAITLTGAVFGDHVQAAAPYDLQGITCNAYVSAADTVRIRLQNETGGAIDLANGTWKVRIRR